MREQYKPRRFGKYVLLDHLVNGGMAEIYRAIPLPDPDSPVKVADKVIAVKMINETFSKDADYKQMFNDEIKVAYGLIHPNVSQTYAYGEKQGRLFTAMEYIDGRNIKQYIERKIIFPKEIAVYITAQAALGLDYVHKFKDKLSGRSLNIIHRDISPQNIMLQYEGSVKIIDFGIAKAETNTQETQAGTLKGKVSYLAPEYLVENVKLDHRYDQFSLGVVLWELLTHQKLFDGQNEMAIIKKVFECKIPAPSSINPSIDKDLDAIVLKALSKKREDRYVDMDDFYQALQSYLNNKFPEFNTKTVANFLMRNMGQEIKEEQYRMMEFGKIDLTPFIEDAQNEETQKIKVDLEEIASFKDKNHGTSTQIQYAGPASYKEMKLREMAEQRKLKKDQRERELEHAIKFKEDSRRIVQQRIKQEITESQAAIKVNKAGPENSRPSIPIDPNSPLLKSKENSKSFTRPSLSEKSKSITRPELTKTSLKKSPATQKNAQEKIVNKAKENPSQKGPDILKNIIVSLLMLSVVGAYYYFNIYLKEQVQKSSPPAIQKTPDIPIVTKSPGPLPLNTPSPNENTQSKIIRISAHNANYTYLLDGEKIEIKNNEIILNESIPSQFQIMNNDKIIFDQKIEFPENEHEIMLITPQ